MAAPFFREVICLDRYTELLEKQLALDYGCTLEELRGDRHVFGPITMNDQRRRNGWSGTMLSAVVYRGKLLVMAEEPLLAWCRKNWESENVAWLSEPEQLRKLDEELRRRGCKLQDAHHHYIPASEWPHTPERFPVRWYEGAELEVFRGDSRFGQCLLWDDERPDLFAVCAVEGETILGMASVTRNCERLWEIGVDVTVQGRGKGVGSYVTGVMKERVLAMGAIPTYATVESHIASQRVAFRAGFMPAFYEIFAEKA